MDIKSSTVIEDRAIFLPLYSYFLERGTDGWSQTSQTSPTGRIVGPKPGLCDGDKDG